MASMYLKLKGKLKWTRWIAEAEEFPEGIFSYKCNLYELDEISLEKLKASGCRVNARVDRDGDSLFTFRRPKSKVIKKELVEFNAPDFLLPDGTSAKGTAVGNGSEAEVDIVVYDSKFGKGHRLNRVKITNLIEYVPPTDDEAVFE